MKTGLVFVFLLLSVFARSQTPRQFVLIDFDSAHSYHVVVDGTPYTTYPFFVVVAPLSFGIHTFQFFDKKNNSISQSFDLELSDKPVFAHLSNFNNKLYFGVANESYYTKTNDSQLNDIVIKADQITTDKKTETLAEECKMYDSKDFLQFMSKYYLVAIGGKPDYIQATYQERCLSTSQLKDILEATFDDDDRYRIFDFLYPKIIDRNMVSSLSVLFEQGMHYKKFIKRISL